MGAGLESAIKILPQVLGLENDGGDYGNIRPFVRSQENEKEFSPEDQRRPQQLKHISKAEGLDHGKENSPEGLVVSNELKSSFSRNQKYASEGEGPGAAAHQFVTSGAPNELRTQNTNQIECSHVGAFARMCPTRGRGLPDAQK